LMGHFRQSKRRASMFLQDLLNIPCSASWTVKIQNLVSVALAIPYEQLRCELTKQPQLFVDESPTKEKNTKASRNQKLTRLHRSVNGYLSLPSCRYR